MKQLPSIRILAFPLSIVVFLWFSYTIASMGFVFWSFFAREQHALQQLSDGILKSLRYEHGRWDTTQYNADPLTPHPTGSSGFSSPLYVITADGFVIERNSPISGLLDSSDFSKLRVFTVPQTITTITNENWRVVSVPIKDGDHSIGVVFIAYYRPPLPLISEIDQRLVDNANKIRSVIKTVNGEIDARNVDVRMIDYDLSFEIVDSFNRILVNNGRTPSFIDVSYVASTLRERSTQFIRDRQTQEPFLIRTTNYRDSNGKTVGVIIVGRSLSSLESLLIGYMGFAAVCGVLIIIVAVASLSQSHWYRHARLSSVEAMAITLPKSLSFNKKESNLVINEVPVSIPYATNQYYLLEAVFSSPKKRWELDELLEKFGVEPSREQWRRVYDAMMVVNKKAALVLPEKLIVHQEKTYRLNPLYLSLLS